MDYTPKIGDHVLDTYSAKTGWVAAFSTKKPGVVILELSNPRADGWLLANPDDIGDVLTSGYAIRNGSGLFWYAKIEDIVPETPPLPPSSRAAQSSQLEYVPLEQMKDDKRKIQNVIEVAGQKLAVVRKRNGSSKTK